MGEMCGGEQERIDGNMSKMVVAVGGERDKEKWRTLQSTLLPVQLPHKIF